MTTVNATEARKELFSLIRRAIRSHEPISIQHREGGIILLSEDDYEGLLETFELLATPGFRESVKEAEAEVAAGKTLSAEDVLGEG